MKQMKILKYAFRILMTVAGVACCAAIQTANGQAGRDPFKNMKRLASL